MKVMPEGLHFFTRDGAVQLTYTRGQPRSCSPGRTTHLRSTADVHQCKSRGLARFKLTAPNGPALPAVTASDPDAVFRAEETQLVKYQHSSRSCNMERPSPKANGDHATDPVVAAWTAPKTGRTLSAAMRCWATARSTTTGNLSCRNTRHLQTTSASRRREAAGSAARRTS